MKTVEKSGKTIDIAIEAALAELGVEREDTNIEILEQEAKVFLELEPKMQWCASSMEENPDGAAIDFLKKIFEKFELDVDIEVEQGEQFTTLNLVGENLGILIGRRGETLDALQYLTNLTVSRKYQEKHKYILDAENYRKKREETLEN